MIDALREHDRHVMDDGPLESLYDEAIRDTIAKFEATGSPLITDGEQRKFHNFLTYCVEGLANTAPDGFSIPFAAGHTRRMPRLTAGPFRYRRYADRFVEHAQRYARVPLKQAVISPVGAQSDVPGERHPRLTHARRSSKICFTSMSPKCAAASTRAPARCRSTSRRRGSR